MKSPRKLLTAFQDSSDLAPSWSRVLFHRETNLEAEILAGTRKPHCSRSRDAIIRVYDDAGQRDGDARAHRRFQGVVKRACQRAAFTVILIERTKEGAIMMKKLKKAAGSQETPVGSKKRTSVRREVSITLGAAVSFLAITFTLGYHLGRCGSPNWDNPVFVRDFMKNHYDARFLGSEGRQPIPESDPIEVSLPVDDRKFTYRTDTEKIAEDPLSVWDREARPSKDYHESVIQGTAFATAAGALLNKVPLRQLPAKARNSIFGAAAVLGAGGICGYYMGYSKEPNYYSKQFQSTLRDPVEWRRLAEDYRTKALSRAAPSATP